MKRIIIIMTLLIACATWNSAQAETKETRAENPHELRLGVGDCSIYYAQRYSPKASYVDARVFDLILPNIFVEYQYRVNSWLSAGLQVNAIGDVYSDITVGSWELAIATYSEGWVHVIPTTTFTYFHKNWVNLYSGIGVGYAMQLETKGKTRNIWHTFAAQATLLGISVGRDHWFGTFEAGALFTGRSFPDRCFNFSVGYRF